jgi:hypothetical protein
VVRVPAIIILKKINLLKDEKLIAVITKALFSKLCEVYLLKNYIPISKMKYEYIKYIPEMT